MGQVVGKIFDHSETCGVCKRKRATRLCDFVVRYKSPTFDLPIDLQNEHETCDFPLCEDCSYYINGHDFCPYHARLLDEIKLPPKMQRLANRVKYADLK